MCSQDRAKDLLGCDRLKRKKHRRKIQGKINAKGTTRKLDPEKLNRTNFDREKLDGESLDGGKLVDKIWVEMSLTAKV